MIFLARPRKRKRVCCVPKNKFYGPLNVTIERDQIIKITVEEYEVIRLIDLHSLSQEECATRMNVARTTIQRLYDEARHKLADSFINQKVLQIEGGNFVECHGENIECCGKECMKHQ